VNDRHARLQQLKEDFDAAHKLGMEGLASGNYNALAVVIQQERATIEEQSILLAEIQAADHQLRLQAEKMPKTEE
jgi:hypothetical protein